MEWKNKLTELLAVNYPIIQAPMLGVTTPEMVAAISNEGGLGSLPIGGLPPARAAELLRKTKQLTQRPFAVNFFANRNAHPGDTETGAMKTFVDTLCEQNNIPFSGGMPPPFSFYKEQLPVLLEEGVRVLSFTFGIPDRETIEACKQQGVVLVGTATCLREAMLLQEQGIDAVVAQGIEAGGHRGTFLDDGPLPQIGLLSLLSQMNGYIHVPVIAAGGIHNGKSIRAAQLLGAMGVQPGTAFVTSDESAALPAYKAAVQQAKETDSVLTRAFTGRWARGISNKLMNEIDQSGIGIPPYPVQAYLLQHVRAFAQQNNSGDFMSLWAGQCASTAVMKPAAEIFREMVAGAAAIR